MEFDNAWLPVEYVDPMGQECNAHPRFDKDPDGEFCFVTQDDEGHLFIPINRLKGRFDGPMGMILEDCMHYLAAYWLNKASESIQDGDDQAWARYWKYGQDCIKYANQKPEVE